MCWTEALSLVVIGIALLTIHNQHSHIKWLNSRVDYWYKCYCEELGWIPPKETTDA